MRRIDLIRGVGLDAVGQGLAHDVRGDAIDQKIADGVRREVQAVVSREVGELSVEAVDRSLQRQHAPLRVFVLVLVEQSRIEVSYAKRAGNRRVAIKTNRLSWIVGNRERAGERSGEEAEPRVRVDECRQVSEPLLLLRLVVNWVVRGRRRFQAPIGEEITTGEKVLDAGKAISARQPFGPRRRRRNGRTGAAERSAVLDRWCERSVTAAIDASLAAVVEQIGAGGDVD